VDSARIRVQRFFGKLGVTVTFALRLFEQKLTPNPPKRGVVRSPLPYNVRLVNSFGGNSIALVSRTQVGSLCPEKNCPYIFIWVYCKVPTWLTDTPLT
jgi:hypothetical protein